MDDFNVSSLHESKNEWGARLLTILTPLLISGFRSIFDESVKLCKQNGEMEKYLMTFQNFVARVPKWNANIVEDEKKRIIEKSGCTYLEELVTCIHIIQLKLLSAMRVGKKQKKIDINIPKLDDFIHKCYINVARKVYTNVYLFELNCPPLQVQKHNRELEIIVQECILNAVRESIPVENILKAYMDETVEEDYVEEIKEQPIEIPDSEKEKLVIEEQSTSDTLLGGSATTAATASTSTDLGGLKFNDVDAVSYTNGQQELINAPKTIERLEEISTLRNMQRKLEEEEEETIRISNEPLSDDLFEVHDLHQPSGSHMELTTDLSLGEIEIL